MRLDPNHANPYGISTYIGDVQVGYLGTDWSATDPWVVWMMRPVSGHGLTGYTG